MRLDQKEGLGEGRGGGRRELLVIEEYRIRIYNDFESLKRKL